MSELIRILVNYGNHTRFWVPCDGTSHQGGGGIAMLLVPTVRTHTCTLKV